MEEKTLFRATVCFLTKDNQVLLAKKTRKIGAGYFNGYGGGIEEGESEDQAAVRELHEEAGVISTEDALEKVAVVDFHNTKEDGSTFTCKVYFYIVKTWQGEIKETEEMIEPTWFDIDKLPTEQMMPADKVFVPLALSGKKIVAEAWYGPHQKTMLRDVVMKEVGGVLDYKVYCTTVFLQQKTHLE